MRNPDNEGKVVKFLKSKSVEFLAACSKVKVEPCKRQASKWLMKKGKAWKEGR